MKALSGNRSVPDCLVLVKSGGDLATGVIHRLWRSGFPVMITEIDNPTMVRRTVSFAECLYAGRFEVEGVFSEKADGESAEEKLAATRSLLEQGIIPVMIDPEAAVLAQARPVVLVDAIMAKRNLGTRIDQADVVIGLGPGFTAGVDAHAVIETARGHDLARVIVEGSASPNTGIPGPIEGFTTERLLRSPSAGRFEPHRTIGDVVEAGETVATVSGQKVRSEIKGVLRGLLREGTEVTKGFKVGDVDPRAKPEHCHTISDKSRAIGGGVLEAIMMFLFGVQSAVERTH
jgi:xanthine dehydrogenase accessory factor